MSAPTERTTCALLVALLVPVLAQAQPVVQLSQIDAAKLAPVRVMVVTAALDHEQTLAMQTRRFRKDLRIAMASDPALMLANQDSTGELVLETGLVMFLASAGGGLIGGIQTANRESAAIAAISKPVDERIAAQHAELGLDERFALALRDALRATGKVAVADEVAAFAAPRGLDLDDEREVRDWLAQQRGDDPRPVLVVGLRQGLPRTLSGVLGLSHAWLAVDDELSGATLAVESNDRGAERADYLTHHADGTLRRTPLTPATSQAAKPRDRRVLLSVGRHALFASPVPVEDLQRPPPALVAQRVALVRAELDPLIERATDSGFRRDLRSQRARELEAAPRWTPVELTEYMRDAWLAPPGDAYPRALTAAQANLASRIAAGLIQPD